MTELPINQKEYLKKYLAIGKAPGEKRKKKKKHVSTRVQIIDDDIVTPSTENIINTDPIVIDEDAPQIVAIIDERPPSLRFDEKTKNPLWQPIGPVENSNLGEQKQMIKGFKIEPKSNDKPLLRSDKSPPRRKKRKNDDRSPPRTARREESPVRDVVIKEERQSVPRSVEGSPINLDDASSPRRSRDGDDNSPPRRIKQEDFSPPRRNRSDDNSPPRRHRADDNSPPRRSRAGDNSPRRSKMDDSSPPRRNRTYDDNSPPRRNRQGDNSPPRRNKTNDDNSPPRRNRRSSMDRSRSHLKSDDASPPRKRRTEDDPSSSRKRHLDSPRRRKRETPPRNSGRSETPPRRKDDRGNATNRTPDCSPPRKTNREERNRAEGSSKNEDKRSKKLEKTLDGKSAGLQNARELIEETRNFHQREDRLFRSLPKDVSGESAPTVHRERKTGRVRDLGEEEERQRKKREEEEKSKEKYERWGRGLAQVESREQRLQEQLHEMSKPLARYADDEDLERFLKEQERDGDPMLAYIRKKRRKKAAEAGEVTKPLFEGEFMPNRYGVRPGHRWDGVDRSNGYEKRWFEVQNEKKAQQEDVYKWSTEDM